MIRKICILVSILFLLFSCGKKTELVFDPLNVNEISGERLWERISVEGDYKNYGQFPSHQGERRGQAPHGIFHRIYINKTLSDSLPVKGSSVPYGSIIVKENLNVEKENVKLTVMAKVKGFNKDGGEWFWAAFDPDGKIAAQGTPKGCVTCHSGMRKNDWIIVHPLNLPIEK